MEDGGNAREAHESGPELSPGKRRVFTALALTFLLLALVEVGLRLAGVGASHPLFVEADSAGRYLHMNPQVSERYFYGDFTAPGATDDLFHTVKVPGSVRIVVQGASTALGFPYFHGAAFPRMLEWRLERALPDREVEVINTALTAVNSHTLLDFADEIVEQEPDAVLIYAGHQEYYGAFGPASTRAGAHASWVSLYLKLRRLRLVQVLSSALDAVSGSDGEDGSTPGTMMERMVGEPVIPLGSDLYEGGIDQFRRNMDALLDRYERAGIPVYLGTLVSNQRDQPPFISQADPAVSPAAWEEAMGEARTRLVQGDGAGALEVLAAMERRDGTNAEAFFQAAVLLDSAGIHGGARELYLAAKDRDLLRFRAPEAMNDVIRELAEEHGAVVVDVQGAFVAAAPDSVVGGSLVTEHVHPTVDGYFTMADAFYQSLREHGDLGSWDSAPSFEEARRNAPVTEVDSLYGVFLLRSLTAGWPFQDDPAEEERRLEELRQYVATEPVEDMALRLFRGQVAWRDVMLRAYGHYESQGVTEQAARVARALVLELPLLGPPYELMGRSALAAGELDQAEVWLRRGLVMQPSVGMAMLLGAVHLRQGRYQDALMAFDQATRMAPPDAPGPARVLNAARSLPELERRAQAAPGDADALFDLATAYAMTNLMGRARAAVERLREIEPDSERIQSILNLMGPNPPSPRPPSGLP